MCALLINFFLSFTPQEIFASVISVLALGLSIWALKESMRDAKVRTELVLAGMLSDAKVRLNKALQDLTAFNDSPESDPMKIQMVATCNDAINDYLTAFDEACDKHFKGDIRKDHLSSRYKSAILEVFEDPMLSEQLFKESRFLSLKKLYNELSSSSRN